MLLQETKSKETSPYLSRFLDYAASRLRSDMEANMKAAIAECVLEQAAAVLADIRENGSEPYFERDPEQQGP